MRIVLTGAGTGGHFYPLIAVGEQIKKLAAEQNIIECELFYLGPEKYDEAALASIGAKFVSVPAGKLRLYPSIHNIIDLFKTIIGLLVACVRLFVIYPDIIFAKGGYGSFPIAIAAKVWGIPIMMHESDSVPGRTNAIIGKLATRVAISYQEAASFFPQNITAWVGQPIRSKVSAAVATEPHEIPRVLVVGGSQGAKIINDAVIEALPKLLDFCEVYHQTGTYEAKERQLTTDFYISNHPQKSRYHQYDFLQPDELSKLLSQCDVVITRAGSMLFEIAVHGKPAIIIPITNSNGDHQKKNAYIYARAGAAQVIEEHNLLTGVIYTQVEEIVKNPEKARKMSEAMKTFVKPEAAAMIAKELISISMEHYD